MSVPVPATRVYTSYMYEQIAIFRRKSSSIVSATKHTGKDSGLMTELLEWLQVRGHMNEAAWY